MSKSPKKAATMQELFTKLSAEQLKAVEETLYRYCEIAVRIFERLEREQSGNVFDDGPVNS